MKFKRVVIKVGSHVLTQDQRVSKERMINLVELIYKLMQRDIEVILVSSGAVSAGYTILPLDRKSIGNKQALAAIGATSASKDVSRKVLQSINFMFSRFY